MKDLSEMLQNASQILENKFTNTFHDVLDMKYLLSTWLQILTIKLHLSEKKWKFEASITKDWDNQIIFPIQ